MRPCRLIKLDKNRSFNALTLGSDIDKLNAVNFADQPTIAE